MCPATQTEENVRAPRCRRDVLRRFAAASVVATVLSQLVFITSYALATPPMVATGLAWLAGAVPNFLLNRRAWGHGGKNALASEMMRYAAISITTAVLAGLATSQAEPLARGLAGGSAAIRVLLVWAVFVGTYGALFIVKFSLVDRVVFPDRTER